MIEAAMGDAIRGAATSAALPQPSSASTLSRRPRPKSTAKTYTFTEPEYKGLAETVHRAAGAARQASRLLGLNKSDPPDGAAR